MQRDNAKPSSLDALRWGCLRIATTLSVLLLGSPMAVAAADAPSRDVIWIEGEEATERSASRHGWYDSVKKDALSGGDWLSHFNDDQAGEATYRFTVEEADTFRFWLRANPVASELSYRLDDGPWQAIDFSGDLRGKINIAADNKPDLRFIAWIDNGNHDLTPGDHTIVFRMTSKAQHHGGIDCFVLTRIPFVPSGTTRPAATDPAGPATWFPVVMDNDPLSPESITDISQTVPAPAGTMGFLQQRGESLQFADAERPTKFWAINASPKGHWSDAEMDQAARWYRKHGVNLVRQHTMIGAVGLLDDEGEFNADSLDHYDRWFAALKRHGIYSTWSVIYPHHGRFLRRTDGIDPELFAELDAVDEEADGTRQPISVNDYINLDTSLQAVAWRYFDKLLGHRNPHTGLAYKDDPALAIVEFQNESNVFFFTLNALLDEAKVPTLSKQMRQRFYQQVMEKYGSRDAAVAAWGREMEGDDWTAGELRLMGPHHWGSEGPAYEFKGQLRRAGDYIEFLAKLQRDYFASRQRQLREAGFRGVTVATAWKSGGPAASMANLYADTAADMIDRHNYFGGGDGGHRIVEGKVNVETHLSQPGRGLLSIGLFQVAGKPFGVSEWTQMPPNPYKAEAVPLMAFYGLGLQDWDASYGFAMNSLRMGDGWHTQGKYVMETPHFIGQFPAVAFAVHHQHFDAGQVIAARKLDRDDVFAGRDVLGQALSGGGHDTKELIGRLSTPPAALVVGRVTISFGKESEIPTVDLAPYHDSDAQTLTSTTGQLVWDYGRRRVLLQSDRTQGVVGFVSDATFDLPAATLTFATPFVSLLLTPLDDVPLLESRHVLVTAMARDKQTGTKYSDDETKLMNLGGPPLLMEPVQASIRLRGDRPLSVKPCDLYGVPREESIAVDDDGTFRIDGRSQTFYYEIRR